jgi:thiamine pyrophosphokinase
MRVVIFANGEMQETGAELEFWIAAADRCIAADGGTLAALRVGVTPDHVIGDMDSLPEAVRQQLAAAGTQFHSFPAEKDETDLELALIWAAEQTGCEEIAVLGAFGGRPDQELANLLLLALPALEGRRVWMVQGMWSVQLLHGGEVLRFEGQPGDRFSLIPLGGPATGISTEGLAFPLCGEGLAFGRTRGVSNRFDAERATVRLRDGLLWCFHENRGAVHGGSQIKEDGR